MDDYLDEHYIRESSKFVLEKYYNEKDYNFFNNPKEEKKLLANWLPWKNKLSSNLVNLSTPDDESEFDKKEKVLRNNRTKFGYIVSNFHIIPARRHFRLDEAYTSSEEYIIDLNTAFLQVNDMAGDAIYSLVKHRRDSTERNTIRSTITNLIFVSISIWITFPSFKEPTITNDTPIISRNDHFKKYCQIEPKLKKCDDDKYILENLEQVSISISNLKKISINRPYFPRNLLVNVQNILEFISLIYLDPIIDSWSTRGGGNIWSCQIGYADYANEYADYGGSPEIRFIQLLQESNNKGIQRWNYKVPMEIKISGLKNLFTEGKHSENDLKQVINLCGFQMLYHETTIAFVVDKNCVLIVEIDETNFEQEVHKKFTEDEGFVFEISFMVRMLDHQLGYYGINTIVLTVLSDAFKKFNEGSIEKKSLNRLKKSLVLTKSEMKIETKFRNSFVRDVWFGKFSQLLKTGDQYVSDINSNFKISIPQYKFAKSLKYKTDELKRSDFEYVRTLQSVGLNGIGFFSDIIKLKYISGPNKGEEVVLKVLNPVCSPSFSNQLFPRDKFFNTLSYVLALFLSELRAYFILNSFSFDFSNDVSNYVPKLFKFGFMDWSSSRKGSKNWYKNLQGFYLLLEYIPNVANEIDTEVLLQEANIAIDDIHLKGILHGAIKFEKIAYHKIKKQVYFLGFGHSTTNGSIRQGIEEFEEAKKKEKEELQAVINPHQSPVLNNSDTTPEHVVLSPTSSIEDN
ncbi:uncharacterized protein RJT21DRAFT_42181 [Scheffersomyces amazonensis]|uniref:uncharacterized protein n=1 Tax=Scheffersomyces amazonensis TaxID=1078765 RepID=UPI00315DF171